MIALLAPLVVACAGMPQNAEEFRKAVGGGAMMTKTESYEVNRPLAQVTATFQKRAPECLNVAVQTVSQTTTSYQRINTTYKPTVSTGSGRTELHVQQLHKGGGVIYPQKPPEGGVYIFVADASAQGNRTKIQVYGPSRGYDVLHRAVRGWAEGNNLGCPDMTKIG
jgi:hypothetical protein